MQSGKPMFSTIFDYTANLSFDHLSAVLQKIRIYIAFDIQTILVYCFQLEKKSCSDKKTWLLTFKTILFTPFTSRAAFITCSTDQRVEGLQRHRLRAVLFFSSVCHARERALFFFLPLTATRESEAAGREKRGWQSRACVFSRVLFDRLRKKRDCS